VPLPAQPVPSLRIPDDSVLIPIASLRRRPLPKPDPSAEPSAEPSAPVVVEAST